MQVSLKFRVTGICIALCVLVACDGRIYTRDGVTDGDTFYLAETAYSSPDPELLAWVAYSLDLTACQLQIGGENPARNSSFDCEYGARLTLAEDWGERRIQNPLVVSRYLDELLSIQTAGFLREYVADTFKRRQWKIPKDLNRKAYRRWKNARLQGHKPETRLIGSWNFRDTESVNPNKNQY